MYKPTFDKHIKLQDEKNSMIDFCNEFWTIKDKKEELVSMIDFLFDFAATLSANKC
jgi:cob(I)alamin adenosyltransferase